jgi:hypothetical protein
MKHDVLSTTTLPEREVHAEVPSWTVTLAHHDRAWITPVRRTLLAGSSLSLQRDGGSFGGCLPVDERVSRRHLRLLADLSGALWAADVGSRNGVWRDAERITSARIEPGEVLRVGGFVVLIEREPDTPLAMHADRIAQARRAVGHGLPGCALFVELVLTSAAMRLEEVEPWARSLPAEPDVEALARTRRERSRGVEGSTRAAEGWSVASDARWFVSPEGERVDLLTRPILMRLLCALLRVDQPVDVPTLTAEIWPGARLVAESGAARVYAAVATLRRLGLRDVLMRREEGYCLARARMTVVPMTDER